MYPSRSPRLLPRAIAAHGILLLAIPWAKERSETSRLRTGGVPGYFFAADVADLDAALDEVAAPAAGAAVAAASSFLDRFFNTTF